MIALASLQQVSFLVIYGIVSSTFSRSILLVTLNENSSAEVCTSFYKESATFSDFQILTSPIKFFAAILSTLVN